jgi:SulP family sulfate permease
MARTRYESADRQIPLRRLPAAAIRAVIREGYSRKALVGDLLAGLVVGIVALPLSMALSIAVGAPPQQGLYTAIVAGFVTALLGGSRTQVTGPTAAFIVVLSPIFAKYGLAGLLVSGLLGGLILIAMGVLRLGKLIGFVPYPVTTGFTAGIALVIAVMQMKDFFGLAVEGNPVHFVDRIQAMGWAWKTASPATCMVGAGTLGVLLISPRIFRRIPAPLVALLLSAVVCALLRRYLPGFEVDTIDSRFLTVVNGETIRGIPRHLPLPLVPWLAGGSPAEPFALNFTVLRELLPGSFAIAMLGAIESLLSAVIADGMTGTVHDPDAELIAQGAGNMLAPFFGGIPATGAIARTATNIRSGGTSPVAAMVHSAVILAVMLILAPYIGYLPMASLAALLLVVAWNMSEKEHFVHMLRVAPKSDVVVLVTCFLLTVVFDMVMAISVGIVLASLLFMRRMAEVSEVRLVEEGNASGSLPLPRGVFVYDISGPLFFGAAQKAAATLGHIGDRTRVVILRMESVTAIDASGLVGLESALERLRGRHVLTILTGLQPQPVKAMEKAGIVEIPGTLHVRRNLADAVESAAAYLEVHTSGG